MWSRRWSTRQKVALGLATGAAAATGAYYCGSWVLDAIDTSRREAEAFINRRRAFDREHNATRTSSHFRNVQSICDATTLPSLLPHLEVKLSQAVAVTVIMDRLEECKTAATPLPPAEKYALWEELKLRTFVAAAGAAVAASVLAVFLRVQLNLVGRYLYLDLAFETAQAERPPQLSKGSQHRFLAYADFLSQKGLARLLPALHQCVAEALHDVTIKSKLTREGIEQLVDGVRSRYGRAAAEVAWTDVLLPPPDDDRRQWAGGGPGGPNSPVSGGSDGGRSPGVHASGWGDGGELDAADARTLAALLTEVRLVVEGDEFRAVVGDAVDAALGALRDRLARECFDRAHAPAGVPLPKLLPQVQAAAAELLADGSPVALAVAALPRLEAFCANLYSSPPA